MNAKQCLISTFTTGNMPVLREQEKPHYLAYSDAGYPLDAPHLIPCGSVSGHYFETSNINYKFFHTSRES